MVLHVKGVVEEAGLHRLEVEVEVELHALEAVVAVAPHALEEVVAVEAGAVEVEVHQLNLEGEAVAEVVVVAGEVPSRMASPGVEEAEVGVGVVAAEVQLLPSQHHRMMKAALAMHGLCHPLAKEATLATVESWNPWKSGS